MQRRRAVSRGGNYFSSAERRIAFSYSIAAESERLHDVSGKLMSSAIREWLNLGVRWIHVFAGIMWVGQTYYFTWLDGQFGKLEKMGSSSGTASAVWMVHSGGFYSVEKQQSLGAAPDQVRWFRWEALITSVGGVVLLSLVYYLGDALIDPHVADISKQAGIAIGVGAMVAGWIIYAL